MMKSDGLARTCLIGSAGHFWNDSFFWSFATLPTAKVLLAALILQTLWFILFATSTTVNACDKQRQFCKHCKNCKLQFTGILQSWIKPYLGLCFGLSSLLGFIGSMYDGNRSLHKCIHMEKSKQRRHHTQNLQSWQWIQEFVRQITVTTMIWTLSQSCWTIKHRSV
jgi:hypothetical protein